MADFRKLVLALAVLALIAVPASAQVLQCAAAAGSGTPTVRGEGLAELVGDTALTCTGTIPDTTANFQLFMNTNVTNKLTVAGATSLSNVTLTVDNGTAVQGNLIGANSILFSGVSIPATTATTTQRQIRITGIRANATQAPAASAGIPGQIIEFISVSTLTANAAVTVFPSQVTVAFVTPGLIFTAPDKVQTFQQCTGLNPTFEAASDIPASVTSGTFRISFTEATPAAFKTQDQEGAGATTGTRLFARFANVPAGARIFVSKLNTNPGTAPNLNTAIAGYVGSDPAVDTGTPADTQGWQLVGSSRTAVWEVTQASGAGPTGETLTFDVLVSIPANITISGGISGIATIAGGFAPTSTAGTASATAPIPRFIESSTPTDVFNVAACVTNLLFPYVTNQAGFDTGIAIVNTSKDTGVFDTTPQSGTCTVYYFGSMGNSAQVPGPQTTANVDAGSMVTFLLSTGGVTGATQSAATFQGYLIARCNFQYAHGFAFISGQGIGSVAQGYLALVIPDKTQSAGGRSADPFSLAPTGSGEQLGM